MSRFDLEDRLVKFAISILDVCSKLPNNKLIASIESQLIRSGISPALMYGEAQAAESRADFIHKLGILLKELRESRISLRIILERHILEDEATQKVFQECNELIGIFTASIGTAKAKLAKTKQKESK